MTIKSFFKKNKYILLILLVAFFLRLPFLANAPVLVDEFYRMSWGESLDGLMEHMHQDFHPPLIYSLNTFLSNITGSVLGVRLIFLLFGMLNLLLIYEIAKEFGSEKIAALIASVNLLFLIFSIQIGPYIILSALVLLSVLILIRYFERKTVLSLVFLGLIWGIGVNFHYYFAFVIGTQALIIFYLLLRNKHKLYFGLIPFAITFFMFLPTLKLFLHQLLQAPSCDYINTSILKILFPLSLFYLPHAFSLSFFLSNKLIFIIAGLLYAIYAILLVSVLFRRYNKKLIILLFSFFGFIFLNLLLSLLKLAKFHARYFSIVLPLYLIIISIGLSRIKNTKLKKILLYLILVLSLISIFIAYSVFPFSGEVLT